MRFQRTKVLFLLLRISSHEKRIPYHMLNLVMDVHAN
jgi:hypothetical protein